MPFIEIYTRDACLYCARAKALLEAKGLEYEENGVTGDWATDQEIIDRAGRRSVPQIFIDGLHIGGSDELAAITASGELDLITREVASDHANGAKGLSDYRSLMLESETAGYRARLRTAALEILGDSGAANSNNGDEEQWPAPGFE